MPLLLHGEVHLNEDDEEEDPYDGERLFITDVLPRLLDTYPKLKVSLEHLSSENAAAFIEKNGEAGRLVATVTPHHLLYGRHEAESNPLLKVKPLIKDEKSKNAVRALVAKGLPFVFAGTDSAPHPEAKNFLLPARSVFSVRLPRSNSTHKCLKSSVHSTNLRTFSPSTARASTDSNRAAKQLR